MNLKTLIALALRGLLRNRRRGLVTLMAIAFGFAAIALFAGYTHNIYRGLSLQAIHGELLGHLTVSKRGMSREGKLDPERYLLSAEDVRRITALIEADPHVKLVTPRLALSGIVSNGRASTIFVAEGLEPNAARRLQDGLRAAMDFDAEPAAAAAGGVRALDAAKPDHVTLAAGLAGLLHLQKGDSAAVLTNTLGGQANALDIQIAGLFDTGNAATNDLYAFMPLQLVRNLYDAEGRADRLTVLLDDVAATESVRAALLPQLAAAGFEMEIRTWNELSAFYTQVRGMFDMIFGFIFSIVLTVVLMSVANSMGMTVVERTREIGTLRAIGLRRRGVIGLFVGEAALLVMLGCILGLLLTLGVRYGINVADISYVPPNQTAPVPLLVDLDAARIAFTALMMAVVGAFAAWMPARRAAKQPIIDALGHV
jgi:putative ABC transport system permease protein